jgi:hypothetical protein
MLCPGFINILGPPMRTPDARLGNLLGCAPTRSGSTIFCFFVFLFFKIPNFGHILKFSKTEQISKMEQILERNKF